MLLFLLACATPDDPAAPEADADTDTDADTDSDADGDSDADSDADADADADSDADTDADADSDVSCALSTDFEGLADGSPWPAPWVEAGGVETADVQEGRGRLSPVTSSYSLARMFAPLESCVNAEATLTFEFEDGSSSGVGYYLRQNGGYLAQSEPAGDGYAGFAEAFRTPSGIGVWREVEGDEQLLSGVTSAELDAGVRYRMRVRVSQVDDDNTLIQANFWPEGETEPSWLAEHQDQYVALQSASGGVAIDAWSSWQNGTAPVIWVDDIEVVATD